MSGIVKCHDPGSDAYNNIKDKIENWVEEAITIRDNN